MVTFPLNDIIALRGLLQEYPLVMEEVVRLRKQLDALRIQQTQILEKVSDIMGA